MPDRAYPPLAHYGLIGDCHSAALVSRRGSIDWCCLPRFDSDSVFGRLLDWRNGGHCQIAPLARVAIRREYLPDSLILVTHFRSRNAEARLIDFFAMRRGGRANPRRELIRIVEGVRGRMRFRVDISPRLDFGAVKPWIHPVRKKVFAAVGSNTGLLVFGDMPLQQQGEHDLVTEFSIGARQRRHLAFRYAAPEEVGLPLSGTHSAKALNARLSETRRWWRRWASKVKFAENSARASVARSAIVLKALTYAPTGAIIAAPTTSLPERIGGERNWDYRYSWVRDSVFMVRALAELGCGGEADGFRNFIQRSSAGNADELQVLYGIDGKRRLTEVQLDALEGWRKSRPVRIGNAADRQFQSDVFGMLLELSWSGARRGDPIAPHYAAFLVELVETAISKWKLPDRGIWEVRSEPRHFVHSKVMCWLAVDRGIELAHAGTLRAPVRRWQRAREQIRASIEKHGIDRRRGVFVQSYGSRAVDAALLLIPSSGFVTYEDERMMRTVDVIRRELDDGGFIARYRTHDGLRGKEGVFLACTFWLAECLAHQRRGAQAAEIFARANGCANDLGLFSEEFLPRTRELLGNFPQGLTHLAQVSAALAIAANSAV